MKDYNFMISDDRLHKTRLCKKTILINQNFPQEEGWSNGGGGLERFRILRGVDQKEGVTFLRVCVGGGSYPDAHYGCLLIYLTEHLIFLLLIFPSEIQIWHNIFDLSFSKKLRKNSIKVNSKCF